MNYLHDSVKVLLNKGAELRRRKIIVRAFAVLKILGWFYRWLAKRLEERKSSI